MDIYTLRIRPGNDLKKEIEKFVEEHELKAASIVTCVGGLDSVVVRMAGATPSKQDIRSREGDFEIVSLVGTLSTEGSHIHLSASSKEGDVIGGHLKDGSIVNPTAEIVIMNDNSDSYSREYDPDTGFKELETSK